MLSNQAVAAFGVLGLATFCLLRSFADRRTPWHVLATVWLAWFLSFSAVLLIPLDVAVALQATAGSPTVAGGGERPPDADIDARGLGCCASIYAHYSKETVRKLDFNSNADEFSLAMAH